jgi:hypothetical protein
MKNVKNIFAKIFMVSVMLMAVVMPTFADNGCEDDNNDAISAEFALCSTHVYNIGDTENPDSTQRDLMNDVVAMKSELITQQMYRHYEQMESMLRRFKTQLEKAVLTSNLQAAGASKNSDDSGSSFKQTDRNVYLAGVSNCLTEMDSIKQIECLNSNYTTIYNLSQNGAKVTTELRKQLANDFKTLYENSINKKSMKEGLMVNAITPVTLPLTFQGFHITSSNYIGKMQPLWGNLKLTHQKVSGETEL